MTDLYMEIGNYYANLLPLMSNLYMESGNYYANLLPLMSNYSVLKHNKCMFSIWHGSGSDSN